MTRPGMGYDWGMTDHTQPPADGQRPPVPSQQSVPATGPANAPPPAPTSERSVPGKPTEDPLRGSRTSGLWATVIALGLVMLLLIIFVAQNTRRGLAADPAVAPARETRRLRLTYGERRRPASRIVDQLWIACYRPEGQNPIVFFMNRPWTRDRGRFLISRR